MLQPLVVLAHITYAEEFDLAQFDLGVPAYFLNELTTDKLLEIKKFAASNGVEVTFHSPGDNTSLFSDYPLIRQGITDEFKMALEKSKKF